MKKLYVLFVLMLGILVFPVQIHAEGEPSRQINVVYDDSGSMISTGGNAVDTWCQAKYAMEVFASMLGTEDQLNIYVMSDFYKKEGGKAKLSLKGNDGAKYNVGKVHEMLTESGGTPFKTVKAAYDNLKGSDKDEKWLVVLTDGKFDGDTYSKQKNLDSYFGGKSKDVNVIYFTIGKSYTPITEKAEQGIYYWHAETNEQILGNVTSICTQVFNSNKLTDIDVTSKRVSFDIPMSQLIVFAQGSDVDIRGITDAKGNSFKSIDDPVAVKYSDHAATNESAQLKGKQLLIDKELKGALATFEGDLVSGDYTIDVSGAKTIEVYYKPNVEIEIYLKNEKGEEVTNIETLEAGTYTIDFGFVKTGTKEIVPKSALLGDVTYEAIVTNNGKKHDKVYTSGDQIALEEGGLDIEATATYLKYNRVTTYKHYESIDNKTVGFSVMDHPGYFVYKNGITSKDEDSKTASEITINPTSIKLNLEGEEMTKDQWEAVSLPKVTITNSGIINFEGFLKPFNVIKWLFKTNTPDSFLVEKADEPGVINITPVIEGEPKSGAYVDIEYSVDCYSEVGGSLWSGSMTGKMSITDKRGFWDIIWPSIRRIAIGFGLFILLLGFTPIFKKRFSKKIKHNPTIEARPRPYGRTTEVHGRFTKDTLSTILPFVAEKGTLKFVPNGTAGVASMKLKSGGGMRCTILNVGSYAGRSEISIDGSSVPAGQRKPMSKSANMTIEVTTNEMIYTCSPTR